MWARASRCKQRQIGAPDTIRTCDLCLRRANAHAPIPEQRIYSFARMGCCKPPATTPQRASLLRAPLPCETALWLVHDVDPEIKGLGQNWMSHHQIPRLEGDQAERSDGNLPFARRLMALLSMTGHWAGQAFVEGEIPFSGVAQTVGFALGRSKMLYLSRGID